MSDKNEQITNNTGNSFEGLEKRIQRNLLQVRGLQSTKRILRNSLKVRSLEDIKAIF